MTQPSTTHAADLAAATLQSGVDTGARTLDQLLTLSREVALAGSEDELVASIARCVRLLFPQRHFCVRIVDPTTLALTSLYAEGKLIEAAVDRLAMRHSAAHKAHLDARAVASDRVQLTASEPLVFEGARAGFATPLVAAGELFGLINLEYPQGLQADLARDEKLLIQLANQAAVGVRNAKLFEQVTTVKKYFEEMIEHANALITVVDREGAVSVFNQALVKLTGYSRAEIAGKALFELVPDDERPALRSVIERGLSGVASSYSETVLRTKSGGESRVLFSTSAVLAPGGDSEGVILIGQDVSRLKELERRVIQAEKMASLGQIAAGVVHELNNPLTTINLYAEALMSVSAAGLLPAPETEKVRQIRDAADRIQKFVKDLMAYARPAQDKPEQLDLHRVLDQAARYCDHALKSSRADLRRDYAGALPPVRGVRPNLVQVFVNLLTNACHALPEAGGHVELRTREVAKGAEIEVIDSGRGIDAKHLPHVFEPFFTTKPEGHGTGLGLTIVQGIVEKHGGRIGVRSVAGQGTTFTVWLPFEGERPE